MDQLLEMLRAVADEFVLPRWRSLAAGEVMEKNPGDLVTVADREAEAAITRWLGGRHPGALVVGEEACSTDPAALQALSGAEQAFTVDPVDGTRNFVHGSPDFGLMVAELAFGEPVRAWIWQPVHRRSFLAERGAGAWSDTGRLCTPAAPAEPARWRLATSAFRLREHRFGALPALVGSWVSCAVDYPQLAAGAATSLLYSHTMPWDHAPGSLLVTEAGGCLTRLDGRRYAVPQTVPRDPNARTRWPDWLLATGDPSIHERVRAALADGVAGAG
jgi:fructose-1,6-bisphosphatase/inositol monophosphatase family enzyme